MQTYTEQLFRNTTVAINKTNFMEFWHLNLPSNCHFFANLNVKIPWNSLNGSKKHEAALNLEEPKNMIQIQNT